MELKPFNKSNLQFIAAVAMLTDHAAVFCTDKLSFYLCHIIGRITIVIMCFFVAEGYYKTHNIIKYIKRMGIFALISQIPFSLYKSAAIPTNIFQFAEENFYHINVIFTLFIGLCLLTVINSDIKLILKAAAIILSFVVTRYSDWRWMAICWILIFGSLHENKRAAFTAAAAVVVLQSVIYVIDPIITGSSGKAVTLHTVMLPFMQLGGLLAIPILYLYNGEKGNAPRWGFYIFYPAHLLLLFILEIYV